MNKILWLNYSLLFYFISEKMNRNLKYCFLLEYFVKLQLINSRRQPDIGTKLNTKFKTFYF